MRKAFFAVIVLICQAFTFVALAQEPGSAPNGGRRGRMPQRPTTYELVDEVRNKIGLDSKEFEKVSSAYDKYIKSVFGDENSMPPRGQRPGMGPRGGHGGPGDPGGFGGPGGDMPPRGMGAPGEGFGGHDSADRPKPKSEDMEKLVKTRNKASEKLCKSIKKLFKKNPEKYDQWLDVWTMQQKRMFSRKAHRNTSEHRRSRSAICIA